MNASSTFPMGLSCLNCQFKHDFNYKLHLHVTATYTVHMTSLRRDLLYIAVHVCPVTLGIQ
jgi:hypothetical protein